VKAPTSVSGLLFLRVCIITPENGSNILTLIRVDFLQTQRLDTGRISLTISPLQLPRSNWQCHFIEANDRYAASTG